MPGCTGVSRNEDGIGGLMGKLRDGFRRPLLEPGGVAPVSKPLYRRFPNRQIVRRRATGRFRNLRLARSLPLVRPFGPCLRVAPAIPFAASQSAQVSRLGSPRYSSRAVSKNRELTMNRAWPTGRSIRMRNNASLVGFSLLVKSNCLAG